ncbi:hypothetical protein [Streptomyces pactum]|uniref:Uncharacterized protein n=1 Tax=Streptomyces pactum TaxID=68249 RepID=A0A1S6JGM6_9ACTN|nr:hypothetical protein [Streptomyces pactum]AQS70882.1 hypothetical protein B1H29_31885 [Streptomyces pactum]
MSQFAAALGAAITTAGVGAVIIARSWPVPTGRHRSTRETADAALLRPVEALDQVEARCVVQDRDTLQLRLATGGTCCTECRHTTPTTTGD